MKNRFFGGKFVDIIVVNEFTRVKSFHNKVPLEHARWLSSTSFLKVQFLGFHTGKSQVYREGHSYEQPEAK